MWNRCGKALLCCKLTHLFVASTPHKVYHIEMLLQFKFTNHYRDSSSIFLEQKIYHTCMNFQPRRWCGPNFRTLCVWFLLRSAPLPRMHFGSSVYICTVQWEYWELVQLCYDVQILLLQRNEEKHVRMLITSNKYVCFSLHLVLDNNLMLPFLFSFPEVQKDLSNSNWGAGKIIKKTLWVHSN